MKEKFMFYRGAFDKNIFSFKFDFGMIAINNGWQ